MKTIFCAALLLAVFGHSQAAQPAKPAHYYSFERNGEYGYKRGLEEKDGKKARPIIMVRYLGESDGKHSILFGERARTRVISSCKAPCEFVKSKSYSAGDLVNSETVKVTEGSVIWAVMRDVQNGTLKPYRKKAKRDEQADEE